MSTKRTRAARPLTETFDRPTLIHMQIGDCLLAGPEQGCGCGLVDAGGYLRVDAVRRLWREHHDEIIAGCPEPWAAGITE